MTHVWQKYDYDMENWGILLISIFFKKMENFGKMQKYDKSMTKVWQLDVKLGKSMTF